MSEIDERFNMLTVVASRVDDSRYESFLALTVRRSVLPCGKAGIRKIPRHAGWSRSEIPDQARNLGIKPLCFLQMPESFRLSAAVPQEPLVFI